MVDSQWGPSQVGVDFAAEVDFYEEESMAFAAEVDCYKDEPVAALVLPAKTSPANSG